MGEQRQYPVRTDVRKKNRPTPRRDALSPTTVKQAMEQVHSVMMEDIMRSGGDPAAIESAYNWLGTGLEYAPIRPQKDKR